MAVKRQTIVLCLVRVGQTTWTRDRRVQGSADLPLSDDGRTAVTAAAGRLKAGAIAAIHRPPDEASEETARIIARVLRAKVKVAENLADPNLGLLEGMTEQVFAERYPKRFKRWQSDPLSLSPPEGEELVDARARLFSEVSRILRRSKRPEVAIVLHPVGFGLLRCWLADRPSQDLWQVLETTRQVERYVLTPQMAALLQSSTQAVPSTT